MARGESRLRELAGELAAGYGVQAQVVPADLSQPAGPGQIMEALAQQHIDVDVLVNNAGFGAHGQVAGIGVARQLDMIEVNVAALTRLTALLLPGMLQRRRGAILNVASSAAFTPGPNQAVYCATKAYVLSFTEAWPRRSAAALACLLPLWMAIGRRGMYQRRRPVLRVVCALTEALWKLSYRGDAGNTSPMLPSRRGIWARGYGGRADPVTRGRMRGGKKK